MIYYNHIALDRTVEFAEYDIALNIHLFLACSARDSLITVTAIDLTPTLKHHRPSLGTADLPDSHRSSSTLRACFVPGTR